MARLETTTNDAEVPATKGHDVRSAPDPLAELRSIPLFANCAKRVFRRINELCARVDVGEGRVLCSEGAIGKECFIVLAGRACVTIHGQPVKSLSRGDIIGEIALLAPPNRRTATVTAMTPMSLLVFNPLEFDALLETDPQIRGTLLSQVTARLSEDLVHANSGTR
jgi:CRP/FNR family transcriptional regulator, cyclic AMP receptor protein